jgi:hypothetical protein
MYLVIRDTDTSRIRVDWLVPSFGSTCQAIVTVQVLFERNKCMYKKRRGNSYLARPGLDNMQKRHLTARVCSSLNKAHASHSNFT